MRGVYRFFKGIFDIFLFLVVNVLTSDSNVILVISVHCIYVCSIYHPIANENG